MFKMLSKSLALRLTVPKTTGSPMVFFIIPDAKGRLNQSCGKGLACSKPFPDYNKAKAVFDKMAKASTTNNFTIPASWVSNFQVYSMEVAPISQAVRDHQKDVKASNLAKIAKLQAQIAQLKKSL